MRTTTSSARSSSRSAARIRTRPSSGPCASPPTRITSPPTKARRAGTEAERQAGPCSTGHRPAGKYDALSHRAKIKERPMGLVASAGDTALIVLAVFWALLVLGLCVVLLGTFRVLESTKMLIDGVRQETMPLLAEVKGSVERTNRELDRVDGMLESAGAIVKRAEKLTGLIEEAASSPLIKIISFGAGLRKAATRFTGGG